MKGDDTMSILNQVKRENNMSEEDKDIEKQYKEHLALTTSFGHLSDTELDALYKKKYLELKE